MATVAAASDWDLPFWKAREPEDAGNLDRDTKLSNLAGNPVALTLLWVYMQEQKTHDERRVQSKTKKKSENESSVVCYQRLQCYTHGSVCLP